MVGDRSFLSICVQWVGSQLGLVMASISANATFLALWSVAPDSVLGTRQLIFTRCMANLIFLLICLFYATRKLNKNSNFLPPFFLRMTHFLFPRCVGILIQSKIYYQLSCNFFINFLSLTLKFYYILFLISVFFMSE